MKRYKFAQFQKNISFFRSLVNSKLKQQQFTKKNKRNKRNNLNNLLRELCCKILFVDLLYVREVHYHFCDSLALQSSEILRVVHMPKILANARAERKMSLSDIRPAVAK